MLDLRAIEAAIATEPLYICRAGPERWAGGMASPEETFTWARELNVTVADLVEEILRLHVSSETPEEREYRVLVAQWRRRDVQ